MSGSEVSDKYRTTAMSGSQVVYKTFQTAMSSSPVFDSKGTAFTPLFLAPSARLQC